MEVTVNEQVYYIGQLKSRQQRNVVKRLLPLLTASEPLLRSLAPKPGGEADDFVASVSPLAHAIASMSDADSDYIFDTCLAVVRRKTTAGFQPLQTAGADLLFEDVKLPQQVSLVFYVIRENVSDFSSALRGLFNGEAAPAETSS